MNKSRELPDLSTSIDRKRPVGDQVYAALKEAIISLEIPPHTSLSEGSLCQATGVSRTPVRRAIARLEDDGLVYVYPQQGTYVSPIEKKAVYNGHFVRRAIEVAIITEASSNWNKEWADKAQDCVNSQIECAKTDKLKAFQNYDNDFHNVFADCAGVEGVMSMMQGMQNHLDRIRYLAVPNPGQMNHIIAEHQSILDALNEGDKEAALTNLCTHLDTVYNTVANLSDKFSEYFA